MYVTKFVVFEKSEKIVVWNTYNLHEFQFSASDSKICVRYDDLTFKQLLSLFWNHFGTIWPCFSYWFLVSFWGYFHIKGYYQLTNASSDLTPFFLGFKLKELAEIRQFEPKNSHSSDTKVAWNPYEVSMALKTQANSTSANCGSSWFTTNHNKDVILNITKKLLGSLNSMPINFWVSITTQL